MHIAEPQTGQIPAEMDWFFDKLLAANVSSMLTIGIAAGGLEFHLAKRYSAAGRPLFVLGLDVGSGPALEHTAALIRQLYPAVSVNFLMVPPRWHDSGLANLGSFDAAFIDGDHCYPAVLRDFDYCLSHAKKLIGFHDVLDCHNNRDSNIEVPMLWKELRGRYRTEEYCATGWDGWGGIGILFPPRLETSCCVMPDVNIPKTGS